MIIGFQIKFGFEPGSAYIFRLWKFEPKLSIRLQLENSLLIHICSENISHLCEEINKHIENKKQVTVCRKVVQIFDLIFVKVFGHLQFQF